MSLQKTRLDNRALLCLTGPDSRSLLQGLITQNIDKVSLANAAYSCLLTPQGKILADFFLIQIEDALYLECEHSLAAMLLKKLRFYKLRADVDIADVSDDWAMALVWAEHEEDISTGPVGQMMGLGSGASRAIAYTDPRLPSLGLRLLAPKEDIEAALAHFDCPLVQPATFHAHRTALGVPESGVDIVSEQTFPLDVNLDILNGMDYSKGCFVGQEVASRMKRKGEIRKRLWRATFQGPTPASGDAVKAAELTIGEISSVSGNTALIRLRLDRHQKAGSPETAFTGQTEISLSAPEYLEEHAK